MNKTANLLIGALTMFLSSCTQMPTFKSFKDKEPTMNIKEYFNGPVIPPKNSVV